MSTYDDEMTYQCIQSTAVSHVVSEISECTVAVSVQESSRSTSSRALSRGSSRGSSTINPTGWTTVSMHSSCPFDRPNLGPDGSGDKCGKYWKK